MAGRREDLESMKRLYVLPEGVSKEGSFCGKKEVLLGENGAVPGDSGIGVLDGEAGHQLSSGDGGVSSGDDAASSDEQSESLASDDLELVDPDPILEIPRGKMTSRLAVVNLDWDHIRSVDIFAALGSFVPRNGRILSVRVYPSEFGKERMQKEDVEGPPRDIFLAKPDKKELKKSSEEKRSFYNDQDNFSDKSKEGIEFSEHLVSSCTGNHNALDRKLCQLKDLDEENRDNKNQDNITNDASSEDDASDISSDGDDISDTSSDEDEEIKQNLLKGNDENDFDMSQLRKYQLERLRYYYAIVLCDSINTAKCIYEQCDGREYEASANFFDLRFVPDEESFDSMEFR
ncbi:hypothetical protein PMAC_002702 [Pneumocystis sp. 'macacae']|nr:hypothetical protein PMAC_002702 [Pneumocystis sp. 'macacae']